MNILYLGYWGADEGLSQATINPHLKILSRFSEVKSIIYISVEREKKKEFHIPIDSKIDHCPYKSLGGIRAITKFRDFYNIPKLIKSYLHSTKLDVIIARSSIAGGLAYLGSKNTNTPFYVESFEPHADYMAESEIWSKYGVSFNLQKHFENQQLKNASGIFPVSRGFEGILKSMYPNQWISYAPCAVDSRQFQFNEEHRHLIRNQVGFSKEAIVGIYVGKFGGNYLEREAFDLFRLCYQEIRNFHLIILSPDSNDFVIRNLNLSGITDRFHVTKVGFGEVPKYLSASDFAFATFKPGQSKTFLSPIKIGEYWANGLPVLLTKGIGDETNIIENEPIAGDLFGLNGESMIEAIQSIRSKINNRFPITQLALKYRSFDQIKAIYNRIIEKNTIS